MKRSVLDLLLNRLSRRERNLAGAVLVAGLLATNSPAAVLTTVPMQGSMVMPMISYHAEHGHLHVTMPTEIPQLTPLLVSHSGDRFDPADPWFDDLDPTRRGLSFSRRYGFVMDTMTDPLPDGTVIYLRKLEGPPELGFYRYSGSAPKLWQPIFGTAGSPDALEWNGMMFHPAVTAPPGTNRYRAVFEAYLVHRATGTPVPHSSTGPFTLEWTNVPDGRPALAIALKVELRWTAEPGAWVLEQTDDLNSGAWVTVPVEPVQQGDSLAVWVEPRAAARFYRLRPAP
ncbi:hypothetical protein [Limisphaera sp. VF-2]|jgi:hypothetical protein|uniref:hypothetical protein n=1 Tax=Limisphaera sp. VF-2 TaxID=3400418 RepID=UPI001766D363|nr:hypothetical protein [Limisphaera sp.]